MRGIILAENKAYFEMNYLFSYVVPVVLMALILNVPKFLEAQFTWTPIKVNGSVPSDNVEYEIGYQTTALRDDPHYIQFYINWTRLITTGIIPMGALIYFNFGIFRGIQVRLNSSLSLVTEVARF